MAGYSGGFKGERPGKTGGLGRGSEGLVGGVYSLPSAAGSLAGRCGGVACALQPFLQGQVCQVQSWGGGHILLGSTGFVTGPWVPLRAHLF